MRLTTRTDLALRTLMVCAANPGRTLRKHEVAEACNASENHLAQVIHVLAQKGYLRTLRGRAGGLMLARPAAQINIGAVVRDFEAALPFADCFTGDVCDCPLVGACQMRSALTDALEAFYTRLDQISLADLVVGNVDLTRALQVA